MTPAALLAGVSGFGRTWWKAALGALLVAPAVFLLGQCDGAARQKRADEAAWQKRLNEALRRDAEAKEASAGERRADDAAVSQLEKELNDAVASLPDSTPSERRRALACGRLRAQGTDVSGLPECRGRPG